jgi:hypothetical protein
LRTIILVIGINLLFSIFLVLFSVKNILHSVSFIYIMEGVVFYLFALLVSGNWLLPIIILCFKKLKLLEHY